MNPKVSRRRFMRQSLLSGLALTGGHLLLNPLLAVEPVQRKGPARLLPSLAAYSFRDFFLHSAQRTKAKTAPDPGKPIIEITDFIDYCASHGCVGAELTSYYFAPQVEESYLLGLKRHAFLRGVVISGSAVGNNFALPKGEKRDKEITAVKQWIDRTALLGASHLRVFAGPAGTLPVAEARSLCIAALEECGDYAARKGVVLGLENHGGIVAEPADLLEILRAVNSPGVGLNLDTGNFHTEDPYADLARCAPYAVNVQVKVELTRRGQKKAEPSDLPRLVKILREANYQGFVALEYEAAEDPWKAVPRWLEQLQKQLLIA